MSFSLPLSKYSTNTTKEIPSSLYNIKASLSALLFKLARACSYNNNREPLRSDQKQSHKHLRAPAARVMSREEQTGQQYPAQWSRAAHPGHRGPQHPLHERHQQKEQEEEIMSQPAAKNELPSSQRYQNKQSRKSHKNATKHNAPKVDQVLADVGHRHACNITLPKSLYQQQQSSTNDGTGRHVPSSLDQAVIAGGDLEQNNELAYHQYQPNAMGPERTSSNNVGSRHQTTQVAGTTEGSDDQQASSMVLVSKGALTNLTDQIAFSLNKMRDLEEQVKVIPELQRRLDHVLSDSTSNSLKDFSCNTTNSRRSSTNSNFTNQNSDDNSLGNVKQRIQKLQYKYDSNANNGGDNIENNHCNINPINRNRSHSAQHSNMDDVLKAINPNLQRHQKSSHMHSGIPVTSNQHFNSHYPRANQHHHNHHPIHYQRADTCANTSNTSPDTIGDYQQHAARTNSNSNLRSACSSSKNSHLLDGRYSNPNRCSVDSRQLDQSDISNSPLRSTQDSPSGEDSSTVTSSPRVEYEDLINDLISLSYSVNYLSSNSNPSQSHSGSEAQSKETLRNNVLSSFNISPSHHSPHQHRLTPTSGNNNSRLGSMILNPIPASNSHHNHHHHQQAYNNSNQLPAAGLSSSSRTSLSTTVSGVIQGNGYSSNPRTSSLSYIPNYNNNNASGSLSLQTTPVKGPLDCGCQSIREHLKYNNLSREQRLNNMRSQTASANNTVNRTFIVSPAPTNPKAVDASTNTELSMADIMTRGEVVEMIKRMNAPITNSTPTISLARDTDTNRSSNSRVDEKPSPVESADSNILSAISRQKLSSASTNIISETCEATDDALNIAFDKQESICEDKLGLEEDLSQQDTSDDEDEEAGGHNSGSLNGEAPVSLGSSYQDPSDFEEYCAYGESLDRRTKDFMSQTTKIPSDLRFALIRLNDSIKRNRSIEQIKASSGCVEVIRKEWFAVAANKDSQPSNTKLYVDYFESFTKQLLNTVVNLTDSAGNTAMHYAASHYKMDVIEVLLDTKVCDVNCRNKAGYTPIMLLALADISDPKGREIARRLFSMGDVNIKDKTSGQTALMLAASHGQEATCKLLLECGADPSLQDKDGSTALMCGSEIGNETIVRCLLAHKLTDPAARDNDGLDAISIAMNNGHKNIGLILFAANNVPRMVRGGPGRYGQQGSYLGASLRRSRGKMATNYVRRSDSLASPKNVVKPTVRHNGS